MQEVPDYGINIGVESWKAVQLPVTLNPAVIVGGFHGAAQRFDDSRLLIGQIDLFPRILPDVVELPRGFWIFKHGRMK